MSNRPGGEMATRPLHFIWICDCSGSMGQGGKIEALNNAIREVIPHIRGVADENPNAEILIRAIKFSDGAQWHISQPTPAADFKWTDLVADGVTDLGKGLSLLVEQLKIPPMTDRALPPVLVLISDGQPTDDYASAIKALLDQPWGKKAVRIAIAMGVDADKEVLQKFIANPELRPLEANNPEALIKQIKLVSTAVLKSASSPVGQTKDGAGPLANVPIPMPADPGANLTSAADVW